MTLRFDATNRLLSTWPLHLGKSTKKLPSKSVLRFPGFEESCSSRDLISCRWHDVSPRRISFSHSLRACSNFWLQWKSLKSCSLFRFRLLSSKTRKHNFLQWASDYKTTLCTAGEIDLYIWHSWIELNITSLW